MTAPVQSSWVVADRKRGPVNVEVEAGALRCSCGYGTCWHKDAVRERHPVEVQLALAAEALQAIRVLVVEGDPREALRTVGRVGAILDDALPLVTGEPCDTRAEQTAHMFGGEARRQEVERRGREAAALFGDPQAALVLRDELGRANGPLRVYEGGGNKPSPTDKEKAS